ncbi:hypothetical protein KJ359_010743 [Pestalotiopsis sp. 9143b]|nr:hypothetical protein KJ359_010743 [Pestalotiopsis sp. 9143b]
MSSDASSPPRSPLKQEQMKQEQMDTSLYSLPRQPLPQPDTKSGTILPPMTNQESILPPITRRESADGPLPGLSSILQAPRTPPSSNQVQSMSDRLSAFRLNVSLDLSLRNDRVSSHQPRGDPIARHLFERRWERETYRQDDTGERYYEQAGYAYRRPSPPNLLRTASLGHRYRPYDISQRFDRNDPEKKLRRNDIPHNNTRYTQEEMDFIRYHKVDLAKPWAEVELVFGHAFPVDESKQRHQQGVQGVFYREHKTMPMLDPMTNSFVYLPNGHVKAVEIKCREQKSAETMFLDMTDTGKAFGLLNLFPEAALTYSWVRDEDKIRIASLGKYFLASSETKIFTELEDSDQKTTRT